MLSQEKCQKACESFVAESVASQLELVHATEKTSSDYKKNMFRRKISAYNAQQWRKNSSIGLACLKVANHSIKLVGATLCLISSSPIPVFTSAVCATVAVSDLFADRFSVAIRRTSSIANVVSISCALFGIYKVTSPMHLAAKAFTSAYTFFATGMSVYNDKCKHESTKHDLIQSKLETKCDHSRESIKSASKAMTSMIGCDSAALSFITKLSNSKIESLETILNKKE